MAKQKIQLSDHFNYSRLLRFVLPCVGTMLFTSICGIVDGLCVSNFVGKTAFAAVNLIMPVPMLVGSVGFMLGTGGSAIVGITLGEGDREKADRYFSLFVWTALLAGIVLAAVGVLIVRPAAALLGAEGEMLDYAVRYGRLLMASLPTFILQNLFQSFFVTAEKPHLGFAFTVAAGGTNMVLDVLLVGMLHGGVEGAAIATFISQAVGGVLPLFYFLSRRSTSSIHLGRTQWNGDVIRSACINGSSELMTNLSMSLVNILYNYQLLRFAGENGVAAYGVIMYAAFLFVAVFVGYDAELLALTSHAFRVYALNFFLMGFNVYGSSFFTALGDGVTSALISFLRTLLFQLLALILLPLVLGIEGVWLAVTVAEAGALCVTVLMFVRKDKVFHYRKA